MDEKKAPLAARDGRAIALGLCRAILEAPGGYAPRWRYEDGVAALALIEAGSALDRPDISGRALQAFDAMIGPDGAIRGYREDDYNLDQVNPGRILLRLREAAPQPRYERALEALRGQLERQPRCPSGGFWHKKIYPNQMWLDGLYMAQPFLVRYAEAFGRPGDFDESLKQFELMERGALDPPTGLLRHGWDESKAMGWADPADGRSPHAWGRAMGWFMMALVDSYPYFPASHRAKAALPAMTARLAAAILRVQDPETGLWPQVMDRPLREGNYLEASASAMFAYALARAERLGMLAPGAGLVPARKAMDGIVRRFIRDEGGILHLDGICSVAGLGGNPYRDGSFAYYVGEPIARDDQKGLGPCILAALETGGER
jgi:unsaturated rhamnogalacturonyl hydrolase